MGNLIIVMDIGQFSSKVGFAGEDSPSQVFLTMIGKLKNQIARVDYETREFREKKL